MRESASAIKILQIPIILEKNKNQRIEGIGIGQKILLIPIILEKETRIRELRESASAIKILQILIILEKKQESEN